MTDISNRTSSRYQSFIRNYLLTSFFYDFIFAYAIYALLFSLHGFTVFQISLLLAWWAFAAIILEIPTGVLADSWSRKKMLVIAPLIKALCFLIWFFAGSNIILYALGFLFWALGSSFVSGNTESFLYDFLNNHRRKEDYEKVAGQKKFYFNIALAIAMISGGFLASINIELPVITSVIPLFASAFFALLLEEVPRGVITRNIHYLETVKIALKEIRSNKVLLYLFIYLLSISIFGNLEEYDQLYYQLVKLPVITFGIVGFSWSLLNATSSYFAHKLKGRPEIFYILPALSALALIFVAKFPAIPTISLLLFSYFITVPLRVLIESLIQRSIQSSSRATVTSAGNLFVNVFGVLSMLFFGFISRSFGLPAIYFTAAIFLVLFSAWVFSARNKFSYNG